MNVDKHQLSVILNGSLNAGDLHIQLSKLFKVRGMYKRAGLPNLFSFSLSEFIQGAVENLGRTFDW